MPGVYTCGITDIAKLNESVFSISVSCPDIADTARAGQFVNVKCGEGRLLRRPLSICQINGDRVKLVFDTKGEGTKWLSRRAPGQSLDILGPLGNGFPMPPNLPRHQSLSAGAKTLPSDPPQHPPLSEIDKAFPVGKIIVAGGGIGSPPMLFAAESYAGTVTALLGFRDIRKIILKKEFESACDKVYIATDDGSYGIHGTVAAPLEELLENSTYDAVLACGPRAMLSAVAGICKQRETLCLVALEERMGCGIGACVVCACATIKDGVESMSRVCKDGPVFDAQEVVWN